jgi:DNA (cytosine-5)-methyltransferase 1
MIPTIIDLFAGAGGLSLGAARADFNISCAVELDPFAFETHCKNFPNSKHLNRDVSALTGAELLVAAGLKIGELHGLIGGPPCQGFSMMGRQEILDLRNDMFGHFFRLVAETQPAFYVAENVPGIMNSKYDELRARAFCHLPNNYVSLSPFEVKASQYGVPTTRTRIFFIGFDPKKFSSPLMQTDFLPVPNTQSVNVLTALHGLPLKIDRRWQSDAQGWRKAGTEVPGVFGLKVSAGIPIGIGNPALIARYLNSREVSGCLGTRHSDDIKKRYGALKYGEQDPISKSIRLNPDGFCPTLRAGTGKEKGSYQAVRPIHYKSPRVITPREAARLQGFPDWFNFHHTKWHSFRQIGNSVSPIVSEAIFSAINKKLR